MIPRRISGWSVAIVSLAIFLFLTESVLRLAHFRYYPIDTGFKITPEYKIFEEDKDRQYVTRQQKTGPFIFQGFPIKKPAGEIRAFVLGGSSINYLGNLDVLRLRLESGLKKGKHIRIINVGGLSYGTNRLLLHFQEILGYEPDIILFYSGENEFEEEYLKKAFFKDNLFTAANRKLLTHSRLYQLISTFINEMVYWNVKEIKEGRHPIFPADTRVRWGITFNKALIYDNYRSNIIKMANMARQRGIKFFISTVAYNRLVPPFKAKDNFYDICIDCYKNKEFEKAKICLEDGLDADLQPHRATKTSNAIIREIAADYSVPFIDVDKAVMDAAQNKIPGFDLFNDHCHLNARGNQILQRAFYERIRGILSECYE